MWMYPGTNRRSRRRYDARACLSCRFILDPEPHPGDKQKRTRTLTPKLLRTPSLLHGRFVRRSKLRVLLSDLFYTEDRASAWPGPLPSLCSPASNTCCPIRNPLTRVDCGSTIIRSLRLSLSPAKRIFHKEFSFLFFWLLGL